MPSSRKVLRCHHAAVRNQKRNKRPRLTLQMASDAVANDNVKCLTCDAPTENDGDAYCRYCGSYWEDVARGLFDTRG